MKLLKTIQFNNLTSAEIAGFGKRLAARAVIFDAQKRVGLLYVAKHNYHKLPGGGIDDGETILEALKRECLEELGCSIEAGDEIGSIIEYRDKYPLNQESFCYFASVVGDKGKPQFGPGEIADGFEPEWVTLAEAIAILENEAPDNYNGKFIQIRDLTFLKEASKLLG